MESFCTSHAIRFFFHKRSEHNNIKLFFKGDESEHINIQFFLRKVSYMNFCTILYKTTVIHGHLICNANWKYAEKYLISQRRGILNTKEKG